MGSACSGRKKSSSSSGAGEGPALPTPTAGALQVCKKHQVDGRSSFMLLPRGLSIIWGEDSRYWSWQPLEEGSDGNAKIEVALLENVCWLDISGKQELSLLTGGVTYKIVFEVMLRETARGWSVPVNLQLKFPDGTVQEHKENLADKPRGQWLQLTVGEVKPKSGQNGDLKISMFEHSEHWKSGLLIKGINIIPTTTNDR